MQTNPMEKFEYIWNKFHSHLSEFVGKRIFEKNLKEDCVQEIFIKIHNGLSSLRDDSKLENWIFQIARNTIADFNRQKVKQVAFPIIDKSPESENANSKNTEIAEWIIPFIQQLPSKYSESLLLYEIEGLSQKEISVKENISLSGAKSRIQRGRVKLKSALYDCCQFEIDKRGNVLNYSSKKKSCDDC